MVDGGLKIAVIGGGSSYTPELVEGFLLRRHELPVRQIWLHDIDEGKNKLEIVGALAKRMVENAGADISVQATLCRAEALNGADFIVTQFRAGQLAARVLDEKIPLRYQVIGQETTGPGGFANAQRTIPVMLEICRDIERLAPKAWLINFTNPAGMVTEAVLKYTKVRAIGLCNVPMGMLKGAAEILGVAREQVYIDFVGLNHLVWGTRVLVDGRDVSKELIAELCKGKTVSVKNIADFGWDGDFINALGMFPCPYHKYYYLADEMLKREQETAAASGTRGEQVQKVEEELFRLYRDPELKVKPPQLAQRGGAYYSDAACSLISSLYNNKLDIQTVNVKNNGTVKDLPDDAVIERNCVIGGEGALPLQVGAVPVKIRGLMQCVKAYEELSIEAAVTGDYGLALQALAMHPLVPSAGIARKILKDILVENKSFLPQYR
jgi:6-phospho-beta-glucosidase